MLASNASQCIITQSQCCSISGDSGGRCISFLRSCTVLVSVRVFPDLSVLRQTAELTEIYYSRIDSSLYSHSLRHVISSNSG